jgi:ribosomal protein L37AE/L43A
VQCVCGGEPADTAARPISGRIAAMKSSCFCKTAIKNRVSMSFISLHPMKWEHPMNNQICSTYQGLAEAYDYFNERLFAGRLPRCLVTMHRQRGAYGYFPGNWSTRSGTRDVTDEIALNPAYFRGQNTGAGLSALAHEMCHHEQYHFGSPFRRIRHDEEWANLMKAIGVIPTKTRGSGGNNPRWEVRHYIVPGGPFALACVELVKSGFAVRHVELWGGKHARKRKYICPVCGLNAWSRPAVKLVCGDCNQRMEGEEMDIERESGGKFPPFVSRCYSYSQFRTKGSLIDCDGAAADPDDVATQQSNRVLPGAT